MLFNSFDFAIFLPIVFILYWGVFNKNIRVQNLLILFSSYLFYGWWDWRFLFLIFLSTIIDFILGIAIFNSTKKNKRKFLLMSSLFVNLGLLGVFKYYNFFLDNLIQAFSFFGNTISLNSLNIILPVGISFYTFQTLSYTIDIYKKRIIPSNDFISFAAFVSFFPQLVAGPIERAKNLLPQFKTKRKFQYNNAVDGMQQILWGFFKKIVIADTCATYSNLIFNNYGEYTGLSLFLGAVFFAFQIYGDFSGYSDIAIGTSRLFGFNLMQNFNFPYFSRDIAEFWRRWHISLSTWFRDYLYIPLGGSKGSNFNKIRNVFIIFLVSGFWHGANWTFVAWGAINAFYFLPLLILKKNRIYTDPISLNKLLPNLKESYQILRTFFLVVIAWVFFRSENIFNAFDFLQIMFQGLFEKLGYVQVLDLFYFKIGWSFPLIFIVFLTLEWLGRNNQFAIEKMLLKNSKIFRNFFYYTLIIISIWFLINGEEQEFIYFQF